MEDSVVKITATEQNKEEGMKRNEDSLRHLWDNIKFINICSIGLPEVKEKQKGLGKIFEAIIDENFPNMENSHLCPRSAETHIQDKLKEEHAKAHRNQTNKNENAKKKYQKQWGKSSK